MKTTTWLQHEYLALVMHPLTKYAAGSCHALVGRAGPNSSPAHASVTNETRPSHPSRQPQRELHDPRRVRLRLREELPSYGGPLHPTSRTRRDMATGQPQRVRAGGEAVKRSRLRRGTPQSWNSTIKAQSKKRARFYREQYLPFRTRTLEVRPWCQAFFRGCTRKSANLHHLLSRGRSGRNEDLIDPGNVVVLCDNCHDYIESHREWALANGWLRKARAA